MRKMQKAGLVVLGAMVSCALVFVSLDTLEARPQYCKEFIGAYPSVSDAANTAKCGICHPAKDKKERNAYGMAVGKALGAANVKEADKVKAGLDKAGEAKGSDGKTFAEQIKDGKLPN